MDVRLGYVSLAGDGDVTLSIGCLAVVEGMISMLGMLGMISMVGMISASAALEMCTLARPQNPSRIRASELECSPELAPQPGRLPLVANTAAPLSELPYGARPFSL